VFAVQLDELIEAVAVGGDRKLVSSLVAQLDPQAPPDWRNLAAVLALSDLPRVVGLSGGQGAGKSTLARLLVAATRLAGRGAAGCSLDDFYLSRHAREHLARTVHPLLATRGVPGTHDVPLALSTLDGLARRQTTLIPVFDKGSDDLLPESAWQPVTGPVSRVVFEGWCLGAVPQPPALLDLPLNRLEAAEDADGRWRRYVNRVLAADYQTLWGRIEFMVYLQVPDFAAVARWRAQQERQLPPGQRMNAAALERFLAHYERLTRWMLESLPARADLVVQLAPDHSVAGAYRH
jgi:D-glycerate 3-kinase